MNKQGLWFITLFSLTLVLGVYYVTMPQNSFSGSKKKEKVKKVSLVKDDLDTISAYKEAALVEREDEKKKLEKTLSKNDTDANSKKEALAKIKSIKNREALEESIEKSLKKNLKLNCFSKISDGNNMKVFCVSKESNKDIALNVMRDAQSNLDSKYNISVKLEKTGSN